jgi:hypothetical protein
MTYKDQFVVEVKANGQILRVKDGAVYLPFGCEYSILLKNLNSKRASVKVSIDGEDVLDSGSLILDTMMDHELKGFLRGNVAKNRFRFIQKTEQIQKHRGDKLGDGLVRVEFAFEKPEPEIQIKKIVEEHHHIYRHEFPRYEWYGPVKVWNSMTSKGDSGDGMRSNITCDSLGSAPQASYTLNNSLPNVDEGITVKGNEISERYDYGSIGELEQPSVIIIELRGAQQSSGVVSQPITVKTKLSCSSCGLKSKSTFKFCPDCGTFLE